MDAPPGNKSTRSIDISAGKSKTYVAMSQQTPILGPHIHIAQLQKHIDTYYIYAYN